MFVELRSVQFFEKGREMTDKPLTYKDAGINYEQMDPFKIACQKAAIETAGNLEAHGFKELSWSRGESAYLVDLGNGLVMGHVEEGLGTKNLVADAVRDKLAIAKAMDVTHYGTVAYDTVAMIVNDLITLGVMPVSVAMHLAAGRSDWFEDEKRYQDLIAGWKLACDHAGAAWGGGETPTLKGIVNPETVVLSGSAVGFVKKEDLFTGEIEHGDIIVLLRSSGIHANGLTLARTIADLLPQGYATPIGGGQSYGEALLTSTNIYVREVKRFLDAGVKPHYAVNITGHGWRKLMRSPHSFAYVIDDSGLLPHPVFDCIQEHANLDDREMHGTYNMGVGFALYFSGDDKEKVKEICKRSQGEAHVAGRIVNADERSVVIRDRDIEFTAEELQVR